MSYAVKNGQTSVILRIKLMDSASSVGAGLTSLTSSSSGLIISTIADNEASATAYTQAGSTIEAVTTLGTYAAPTATKCRFKEVDATNHKGIYEIQIADARFAVSSAKSLLISVSGVTNLAQCDYLVPLIVDDPYVAKVTSGTGAGQISLSSGAVTVGTNNDKTGYTASTVSDKTGYSLTQTFPTNFSSLGISAGGHISNVDTLTTYTGNTVQTGDAYARIGAAGAGLTALGDTRIAHLDADVSSRSTFAGGAVASVTGAVGSVTGNVGGNVTGSVGSISGVTFPTHFSSMAIDVSGNVTFGNTSIGTVTTLTNLPSIPANWLTAAGIAAAALNGKGDWNIGKTGYSISGTITSLDSLATHGDSSWATATGFATPTNITAGTITTVTNLTNAPTSGNLTAAMKTDVENSVWNATMSSHTTSLTTGAALNAAGAAGDPWSTALPGAYGNGTAGKILGTNLDAAVSTRLATSGYTAPDNSDITAIKAVTDALPTFVHTSGKVWALDSNGNPLASAASVAALPTANQNADALLDRTDAIETGLTPRQAMRLSTAVDAGKLSGAATNTNTIRNAVADSKNRIVATVDASGNRTAITTDLT